MRCQRVGEKVVYLIIAALVEPCRAVAGLSAVIAIEGALDLRARGVLNVIDGHLAVPAVGGNHQSRPTDRAVEDPVILETDEVGEPQVSPGKGAARVVAVGIR